MKRETAVRFTIILSFRPEGEIFATDRYVMFYAGFWVLDSGFWILPRLSSYMTLEGEEINAIKVTW